MQVTLHDIFLCPVTASRLSAHHPSEMTTDFRDAFEVADVADEADVPQIPSAVPVAKAGPDFALRTTC